MNPKKSVLVALCLVATTLSWGAYAGEGHDHGDEGTVPASGNGPHRLPDGSVFLPKPAQRQIGVRTLMTEAGVLPRTLTLAGRVVMDPNAGGVVQAATAGRLEAGPKGFSGVGQRVKKGEVLAYVVSTAAPLERASQRAQVAELRSAKALAEKRVARLKELADTVPRKEIEAAESEASSLAAQLSALDAGLGNREALVAPVSGVIASSKAMAGQIVDARELVFEIVDPQRLRIEALAYDAEAPLDVAAASVAVGGEPVALRFIGAGKTLREQALPLSFGAEGGALEKLAVGQPVEVFVQTKSTVKGVRVPAASVLKNPANQSIVWVKTAPERFEPRPVTIVPLDGANVAVTSGLAAGERVATEAANLINQIR